MASNPAAATKPSLMDHKDPAIESALRDKAIVAIHLRRYLRPKSGAGWGANRDDHPLFEKIANAWVNNTPSAYTDEELYTARQRVRKYERQLIAAGYRKAILDASYSRDAMVATLRQEYAANAEHQLNIILSGETYGQW